MKPAFTLSDGSAEFPNGLVRRNHSMHHREINSLADLKACLRAGRYTSVGGYPLFFLCANGDTVSFEGVKDIWAGLCWEHNNQTGERIVACDVNWEDADMVCAITGKPIESAYGAPDTDKDA